MVDITTLLTFRMDRLDRDVSIVDGQGNPTHQFQQKWQDTVQALVDSITLLADAVTAVEDAQTAADAANAAAAAADAAAVAAQAAADDVMADSALANSYVTGLTLTATDAGASATITISAHTRVYGDGTIVAVSGGSVTGLAYSTDYRVYYDDAARTGGAVTYAATTSVTTAAQLGDRHSVGAVTTPAAAAGPNNGNGAFPPGYAIP